MKGVVLLMELTITPTTVFKVDFKKIIILIFSPCEGFTFKKIKR